jgi:hypothetical protein
MTPATTASRIRTGTTRDSILRAVLCTSWPSPRRLRCRLSVQPWLYLELNPDRSYPQQYSPPCIQWHSPAGQTPPREYEERHAAGCWRASAGAYPAPARWCPRVPVDEIPGKKYLLHMLVATFPQVRAVLGMKKTLYPQASPQAVHKLCPVLHRLSTTAPNCWLCGWTGGGYRSGVPVFHGRTRA